MSRDIFLDDADLFSQGETRFFSILYPLFHQQRKPNAFLTVLLWVIFCIQMVAVALFRIDNSTQAQTVLSKVVNFVDLSSLSLILGKNSIFLIIGFLIFIMIIFSLLLMCSILFRSILTTQPWIITLVRILHDILLRILYIPIASVCITMIDCYKTIDTNELGEKIITKVWRAASDNVCMSNIYQIVGLILTVIALIILLVYCGTIDLLIFNFNPKNGGLFSCPDGFFNFIQHIFILSLVFILRYIYPWEFWRAFLSIGDSIILITYIIYKQPYYSFKSNFMAQIPWIIFGSIRLCAEIGYSLERWHPKMIEPSVRFLQYQKFRTQEMMLYSEVIYTQAVRRHMHNTAVLFHFWNFLIYFKKNFMKGEAILKLMKRRHMSYLMKFIIYSYNKEKVIGIGIVDKDNLKSETSFIFLQKLAFAQKNHKQAKEYGIKFFEYVTNKFANCQILYDHVRDMSNAEFRARTTYEELLTLQPQNVSVLKQYAQLLIDIFRDEDSAQIVMSKALSIEKQNQGNELDKKQSQENNKNRFSQKWLSKSQIEFERMKLFNEEEAALLIVSEAKTPMIQYSNIKQQMDQSQSVASKSSNQSSENKIHNEIKKGLDDGEAEFFISWDQICEKLLLYSDHITSTLENIYSIIEDANYWEETDIIVQVFDIRLDLKESQYYSSNQSSSQIFPTIAHDEPIQYSNQEQMISLIRSLTLLAQKSREMAIQPYRQEVGSGDIAYACFNSIQPVFIGCKRVLIDLWEETQKQRKILVYDQASKCAKIQNVGIAQKVNRIR
ncbi:MAG: hypothetical protein EZS28_015818 [Streblomastix strix]|uniref:TmcB/TmcC TPR repeats domain-containing protein n=1 Tax=Streblomastix strix TaxID=222440 RepID=A0A5J4W1C6_9EUKA|nr:MAG: hypothetical protein EZS28_015818 [Streblomastix strix]